MHPDDFADIEVRAAVIRALGTPAQRKDARKRAGLSLRDVAQITGLTVGSIQLRESDRWQFTRGSLDSPKGWAYVQLIATLRGVPLTARGRKERSRAPAAAAA